MTCREGGGLIGRTVWILAWANSQILLFDSAMAYEPTLELSGVSSRHPYTSPWFADRHTVRTPRVNRGNWARQSDDLPDEISQLHVSVRPLPIRLPQLRRVPLFSSFSSPVHITTTYCALDGLNHPHFFLHSTLFSSLLSLPPSHPV